MNIADIIRLSVSSVGSEAMQQNLQRGNLSVEEAFSILGRIGGDATLGDLQFYAKNHLFLSVSSVGSEAMQQETQSTQDDHTRAPFSILGRIGGDATDLADDVVRVIEDTFSILGRIGGDAT